MLSFLIGLIIGLVCGLIIAFYVWVKYRKRLRALGARFLEAEN